MVDFLAGGITRKATPMPLALGLAAVVFRVAVEGAVPSVVVEDVDGAGSTVHWCTSPQGVASITLGV